MAEQSLFSSFGPTPEELQKLRRQEAEAASMAAQKISPQYAAGYGIGNLFGGVVSSIFGIEDPELKRAKGVQTAYKNVLESSGGTIADQGAFYDQMAYELGQQGLSEDAVKASMLGNEFRKQQEALQLERDVKQSQIDKANAEAAIKVQDFQREEQGRQALIKAQQDAAASGTTLSTEDVISVLSPYMSAEKLAGMMQTSADKAAYRGMMQAQIDTQKELGLARISELKDKDIRDNQTKLLMKQIDAQQKALDRATKGTGGAKSSVYERGYANNFVTSTAELVPATTNLNVLTNGGTSPVTAGVFSGLKGTGVLSSTGAALGTAITPTESGQYESIMLPVIANVATMQNAGRRTTLAQIENLKNAILAKPGQPYIVQVQKMGELRQIVEAAADAAKTNPAMSDDQLAAIQGNVEKVRQAIPFTGTDVTKYSQYAKKNPTVKFVDWLKVNGSDKEAFQPAVQEKTVGNVTYINDGKGWKKK